METQTMTFKIPTKMSLELERIGETEERTKAWLIRKAIEKFLEGKKK